MDNDKRSWDLGAQADKLRREVLVSLLGEQVVVQRGDQTLVRGLLVSTEHPARFAVHEDFVAIEFAAAAASVITVHSFDLVTIDLF